MSVSDSCGNSESGFGRLGKKRRSRGEWSRTRSRRADGPSGAVAVREWRLTVPDVWAYEGNRVKLLKRNVSVTVLLYLSVLSSALPCRDNSQAR